MVFIEVDASGVFSFGFVGFFVFSSVSLMKVAAIVDI
jgi:hypothetical protein